MLRVDARQRDPATQQLKMCEEKNVAHYLLGLCVALMNEQVPVAVRQLGVIQIKNVVSAKSEAQRQRVSLRWMTNVPDDVKNNIKQMVTCSAALLSWPSSMHTNIMRVSMCVCRCAR